MTSKSDKNRIKFALEAFGTPLRRLRSILDAILSFLEVFWVDFSQAFNSFWRS